MKGNTVKAMVSGTVAGAVILSALAGCSGGVSSQTTPTASARSSQQSSSANSQSSSFQAPTVMGIRLDSLTLDGTLNGQFKGKKIVVATSTGDFEKALKDNKSYFEQLTGGTVDIESFPGESYMEKIQMDLSNGGDFDAVLMPIALIHGYAQTGLVKDLQPLINQYASKNYDINDFLPGLFNTYAKYGGKTVAIPYKPDVEMMFYRKDIFNDPTVKAKYKEKTGKELAVPKTPEELLETAKFFTKKYNSDSPVTYGFSAMGSQGNSRWLWTNRLGVYGGNIVDSNLAPAFNNDAGVKAMEVLKQLTAYVPPQWQEFKWEEANNFFIKGDVAMMEQWPGLYYTVQGDGSKVKDKVSAAVTPGGVPTLGGWALAISDKTKNAEMAWKFIEYCTSKDGEILKIKNTMDPCRQSNFNRKEVADSNPLYPTLLESLKGGKILADADVPVISNKLNDVEELAVQDMLNNKKSPKEAVSWMTDQFTSDIKEAGLAK